MRSTCMSLTRGVLPQKCGKRCLITTCRITAIKSFGYRHFLLERREEFRRARKAEIGFKCARVAASPPCPNKRREAKKGGARSGSDKSPPRFSRFPRVPREIRVREPFAAIAETEPAAGKGDSTAETFQSKEDGGLLLASPPVVAACRGIWSHLSLSF